jgi:Ankyrin repeats (3 copies)
MSSCPCKNIPWSLSSFTAAEYGDANALSKALTKTTERSTAKGVPGDWTGGITPLHLAAQHGHVAATWMLLEQQGYKQNNMVDGNAQSTCTPLHRASFSGAITTMRLLLETNQVNLLAKDVSFGDERTPLHKAAAGGRFLAVALLLDALRSSKNDKNKNGQQQLQVLNEALTSLDRHRQTPLQVAQACHQNQDEERQSVARWDMVAGGTPADWQKCVALLQEAEKEMEAMKNTAGDSSISNARTECNPITTTTKLPPHRFTEWGCALDCERNGECVATTWSMAFHKALQQAVTVPSTIIPTATSTTTTTTTQQQQGETTTSGAITMITSCSNNGLNSDNDVGKQQAHLQESTNNTNNTPLADTIPTTTTMGRSCDSCGRQTFVLFPSNNGGLVCKPCKKPRRRRPG